MNDSRVVITGLGALTPVGNDVPTTWHSLLEGQSGIQRITLFDPSEFNTQIAGEVKGFEPKAHFGRKEARRLDRYTQFAIVATQEALEDAHFAVTENNSERVGVVIGSGVGGISTMLAEYQRLQEKGPRRVSPFSIPNMLIDTAAGQVAITFGAKGPNMAIVSACATGSNAVGEAAEMIRRGAADVIICGGSEAVLVPLAFAGFNIMRALSTRNDEPERACRPFDATRDGFVMSEGAGILLLESLVHARARGAKIYGEIIGYGSTVDAFHMAAPADRGEGAARAMAMALAQAGIPPQEVDYLNAHGTGTELNDKCETQAIKTVFGDHAYDLAVSSTKSMIGHLLGAAGAVEAIACLKALEDQILPPTINYQHPDPECDLDYVPNEARPTDVDVVMSNSMGLGGHNASLIFRRVRE
ncbi:MAG: beta-ketoacyl-ACP synthase II [Anaerolineae bacterium]